MPAKPQLASTGAAIDAALDDETNALREQAKKDSDANFAAEEADRKARGQQLRNIKGAPSQRSCRAPPVHHIPPAVQTPTRVLQTLTPLNSPTTTFRGHGVENRPPAQLRAVRQGRAGRDVQPSYSRGL